jgi:hypothetical protein
MNRYDDARRDLIVREVPPARIPEIEIQARLFAGEYGSEWTTTCGRRVRILHFGDWNREAGPDFKGVRFRFDDADECEGDLEVDMDARDWERHGHATNPAYNGVRLQLFVNAPPVAAFARTSDFCEVPQARLALDEKPACPLGGRPGAVTHDEAQAMIEEAAEFRLRSKSAAHARAVTLHGPDTALFYALAAGLGYKNNAIPFLLAAQRAGLRASGGPLGEALLFGLAGFLRPREFDEADEPTRSYLKPLWESWWTLRDPLARLVLPREMWKFSGIRPSNHPHRRLGALAATAAAFPRLRAAVRSGGQRGFEEFFRNLSHPYWSRHWNLSAARLESDLALVGPDRVRDLLVNAYFPSLPPDRAREAIRALPGTTPGGRIRLASEWLVGSVDRRLMRSARQQQGLLQLYSDFGSLTALEAWARIGNPIA